VEEQVTGVTNVGGGFNVIKRGPFPTRWLILLTLAFTLFQIGWSFRFYRLRAEPRYDDILYMSDAAARLSAFDHQSIFSWFVDLVARSQPHSPYSSVVAFLAFALFGYNEWAPYLLNGVLIFVLLMEIRRISTALPWYLQFVFLLFPLCLPLSRSAIVEFRPDFAEGLFGAVTVWRALELKFLSSTLRPVSDYIKLTGLAVLTWLTKPTFFIHTAILMGVVTFLCLVLENRNRQAWIRSLAVISPLWLGLLIVSPYFLASWRSYWSYFKENTGGGSLAEVWRVPGGLTGSLKYYLFGLSAGAGIPSAAAMLGPFLGAFGLIALVGLTWFAVQRDRRRLIFYSSVGCVAAVSLAVVVYGGMKGPCFGLTFQILFVLMIVFALVSLLVKSPFKGALACVLTTPIWICAAAQEPAWQMLLGPNFVWAKFNNPVGNRLLDNERNGSTPINERFYSAIVESLGSHPLEKNRSPIINICLVGDIIAETQKFYADRDQRSFAFKDFATANDLEAAKQELAKGDFVELADLDSSVREMRGMPIAKIEDELIQNLSTDPKYRLIERFQLIKGFAYLFRKVDSH
jgi:hypothetical protein